MCPVSAMGRNVSYEGRGCNIAQVARQIAQGVKGVREVRNHLSVKQG